MPENLADRLGKVGKPTLPAPIYNGKAVQTLQRVEAPGPDRLRADALGGRLRLNDRRQLRMTATLNDELHRAVDVAGTAQSRRPPAASCTLGAILTDLDEQTRAGVLDALNLPARSGGKSDEALAAILTRHGRPVHWQTVRRHRVGACACPTPATARDAA